MYCKTCYYDLSRHAKVPFRIAIMTTVFVLAYWLQTGAAWLSAFQPSITHSASIVISQHQTLQSQLHLYANQHNNQYPTLAQMQSWDVLTMRTDIDGNTGTGPGFIYGPYLQHPIANAFNKSSTIATPSNVTRQNGWAYNETTGHIRYVVTDVIEIDRWKLDPADLASPNR